MKNIFLLIILVIILMFFVYQISININDMYERIIVLFVALAFLVAAAQAFSAQKSASAAKASAQAAKNILKESAYIHLANIWYDIKKCGLEKSNFLRPEFTTLYRSKGVLDKYREYYTYAWICWGHAEDCFIKQFNNDSGFLPSIVNYKELHYAWLSNPKNSSKFNRQFMDWVKSKIGIPQVYEKSTNSLQGRGVFSETGFSKGDYIGFFEGKESIRKTKMSLQFDADFHIEPSGITPFRYLNHSCEANAYFRGRNLYAWSEIYKGQEITIDYNCSEEELLAPFKCNCNGPECVHDIKGFKHLDDKQKKAKANKCCEWLS